MLYSLLDIYHINDVDLQMVRPYSYFDHYLPAKAKRDIEQLREVSEPAIQAYKDAGFSYLRKKSKKTFSNLEGQTMAKDFLSKFCPECLDFYDEMWDKNNFLVAKQRERLDIEI